MLRRRCRDYPLLRVLPPSRAVVIFERLGLPLSASRACHSRMGAAFFLYQPPFCRQAAVERHRREGARSKRHPEQTAALTRRR